VQNYGGLRGYGVMGERFSLGGILIVRIALPNGLNLNPLLKIQTVCLE